MFEIGIIGFAITCVIALVANNRFGHLDRLPMQWGLKGQVNWTASRPVALAFIPVIYALMAAAFLLAANHAPEKYTFKTAWFGIVVLIAVQILHLFMIAGSDNSRKR